MLNRAHGRSVDARRLSRALAYLNLRLHVPFETVPLGKTSRLMRPQGTEGTTALRAEAEVVGVGRLFDPTSTHPKLHHCNSPRAIPATFLPTDQIIGFFRGERVVVGDWGRGRMEGFCLGRMRILYFYKSRIGYCAGQMRGARGQAPRRYLLINWRTWCKGFPNTTSAARLIGFLNSRDLLFIDFGQCDITSISQVIATSQAEFCQSKFRIV